MGVKIRIEFTDNKTAYRSGENVSGIVFVDCSQPESFEELSIVMKGSARVRWTENHGKTSTTYTGKEKYFEDKIVLKEGGNGQKIPSGTTTYPFSHVLCSNLPSTLEVTFGYVRYRAQATLKLGMLSSEKAQTFFSVLEEVDLNQIPNSMQPSEGEDSKTICCLCCKSGLIEASVKADKTGYVPGEFVVANGRLENGSNRNMKECKFKVVQRATLHASAVGFRKTKVVEKTLVKQECGKPCRARSQLTMDSTKFQIPPAAPSYMRLCSIIDLEYFMRIEVKTPSCSINLSANAPLIVGTIPLGPPGETSLAQPNNPPPPYDTDQTTHTNRPEFGLRSQNQLTSTTGSTDYQRLMSMHSIGTADTVEIPQSKKDGAATSYTPQYSYYDWSQTAFSYK